MAPIEEKFGYGPIDFEIEHFEAYASATSVKQGDSIDFHVWADNNLTDFKVEFIRKGFPDVIMDLTASGTANLSNTNSEPWENGCGWDIGYTLSVPEDWDSGAYIALFNTVNTTTEVLFIVKQLNSGSKSKILLQSSINTAQAYNNWGGKSLYDYNSYGPPSVINTNIIRSFKVSFNRPMKVYDFYKWEYPFIQWLEREGFDVEFCTNVDLHADSTLLNNYKLFLSVGHDEYWSKGMRDNIEFNLMNNGGNIAFFSGNTCWWQVRFEPQDDGQGSVDDRLMVCFKEERISETVFKPGLDPYLYYSDPEKMKTTCNWYDKITDNPENLMTGVSFYNGANHDPSPLPIAYYKTKINKHWLLQNTNLQYGGLFGVYGSNTTIGYETDAAEYVDMDKMFPIPTGKLPQNIATKSAPKDFIILASSNLTTWAEDGKGVSGYNNHNGWVTMGIYRNLNGGFCFTAGTTDWSNGLLYVIENDNSNGNEVHIITKNVLRIFGVANFESQQFVLDNPNFEDWTLNTVPDGWYKEGLGNIEKSSAAYSGQYSLKVDASKGRTWISQNYIPIRTNSQYRVKCIMRGEIPSIVNDDSGDVGIMVRLQTTDNYTNFVTAYYTGTDEWLLISADGQISNTEALLIQARVKIEVSQGFIAYFDEVVVEQL